MTIADSSTMSAQPSIRPAQTFLFMLPASATEAERKMVLGFARRLALVGEVYVACAQSALPEDREGLRFMPLQQDLLTPCTLPTAIFVIHDEHIAEAARQAYPDARVLMIDLR